MCDSIVFVATNAFVAILALQDNCALALIGHVHVWYYKITYSSVLQRLEHDLKIVQKCLRELL